MPKPSPQQHSAQSATAVQSNDFLQYIARIHNFGATGTAAPSASRREPGGDRDLLANGDLVAYIAKMGNADALLAEYHPMSTCFPFVSLPADTTAHDLREKQPVLLLAIMTVASWKDRSRQLSLERRFRYELAHRTIIQPRKSLELVQSVLVYLYW